MYMFYNYKLKLKRKGRYKKPFYDIVVVNKKNKLIDKLGSYNSIMIKRIKKIEINIFLFYCWLMKGLKVSFFLSKIIKTIFFF